MQLQNKVVFTTRQVTTLLPIHSTNKTHLPHDGKTLVFHTGEETIDTVDEMGEWELN